MDARDVRIDALRGMAILAVLQFHLFSITGAYDVVGLPQIAKSLLAYGWAGVDLFFVLSAYLLTSNLLRHADCAGLPLTFYKRRALRILPLYLLLIAIGFGLEAAWTARGGSDDAWLWSGRYPLAAYLLFAQNWLCGWNGEHVAQFFAPTWSLAVEEHFYLVLPLIAARLSVRGIAMVAIGWIVTAPLIRFGIEASVNGAAPYVWSVARLDSFGWGMLIAAAPRLWPTLVARLPASLILRGALPLGGLVALLFPDLKDGTHSNLAGITSMTWLAASATFAAVAPRAEARAGHLHRAFAWCGQRCYSLYLMHMPVLGLSFMLLGRTAPVVLTVTGLCVVCVAGLVTFLLADIAYRRIELPCMALAKRYAAYERGREANRQIAPQTRANPALSNTARQCSPVAKAMKSRAA